MPASFRIITEKFLSSQNEYWTNVYWCDSATLQDAATTAAAIVAIEQQMLLPACVLTKYRVDDAQPLTDVFVTTPVNLTGQSGATGEALPLFNVARFDFSATAGRPSRKYYRGVLTEAWTDAFGVLNATALTSLQSWADQLAAVANYVDVDGEALTAGTVFPRVGMRQLRRGSKKKLTP